MTYEAFEESAYDGRPVELYEFTRGHLAWRYTSADRDVTVDSILYKAAAIRRPAIEDSSEIRKSEIKLTVPRDLAVADLYRISPPTDTVNFFLRQYHANDPDVGLVTLWTGRITSVIWSGSTAEISLEPSYTAIRRMGLRRFYQRQCPHVLYGPDCRVNRESFRVDGIVDGVAGLTVSVPQASTRPTGHFDGGFIEYEIDSGIWERRFVTDHVGSSLTCSTFPTGLAAGMSVRMYPGCDHTTGTCAAKFSNILNYGGMPYFPEKNPFGGDPIF